MRGVADEMTTTIHIPVRQGSYVNPDLMAAVLLSAVALGIVMLLLVIVFKYWDNKKEK